VISFILITLLIHLSPSHTWGKNTLKAGVFISAPPFSFYDQRYNVLRGFSVDLAQLLTGNMGAVTEFYAVDDSDWRDALNDGRIDFISGIMINPESAKGINLIEMGIEVDRKFFVNHACLTVTCDKDLPGHKVAVEMGRDLSGFISSQENIDFMEAESQEEALALLDSGEADVYISDCSISTLYIIQKKGFQNIKEVGMPIETVPLALAVQEGNTELLTSLSVVFGKLLANDDYDTLIKKWLGRDIRYADLNQYLKHIMLSAGLIIFLLMAIIFWNRLLKRKVRLITKDLQRSEQKYRDLIESSPDMIHLISPLGEIRLANKIALAQLGYDEKEVTSLKLQDLVLPEQAGDVIAFVENVFRDNYSNKEFSFRAKTGNMIHVEMVATIVKESETVEDLACCFSRDLTERKRLEEDLIHSDRLAIMGRMAAGLAHEINNPLGIILTNAEDVLNHELNAKDSHESLQSIERNALRAAKIIEDLLTFTRPTPPKINPIDLAQLIDSSLLFLKQKLKQKNINVEKSYPPDPIMLNGDENLIQQLLINLILNAIQAIKHDEGLIIIRVNLSGADDNRKIILKVEDDGIGIPDEDIQKIFDPFFTSRKENGFGLGLFISRIIVEKHAGNLIAQSRKGKGTVMTVEFPVEPAPPASN
jgi:PAS domain S-box-containing protein